MNRKASAVWRGDLKTGAGTISSTSGVLAETQYSFKTRFENGKGTNPEELIAAAHASCYAMALSHELATGGHPPDQVHAEATVTIENVPDGFAITKVHLTVRAKVPGIDRPAFDKAANSAKANCPVSKVLNAEITMDATLEA